MKPTLLAFLLLFAFSSQSLLLGAVETVAEAEIDISGKKLKADANYYIIPAMSFTIFGFVSCFNGESLVLDSNDDSCYLDVIVEKENQGLPLRFTPINTKKVFIRVSTDLNIAFSDADERCPQFSTMWKLGLFDASMGQTVLTIGGRAT